VTLIDVEGLGFRYVGRKRPALQDVSFHLEAGESLLVLGPSGSGKSTLALCLNGAIPHFVEGDLSGSVRVNGANTRRSSMAGLAQRVGIVFQDPEMQFCMLRVDEEVAFGLENLAVPRDEMRARIGEALDAVGLADRERDPIAELSGGQKQRLALACVLAQRPDVLVFDEPTAQLDPAAAADFVGLLGELRARRQHTLVIVEHRLDELMHLIDKVLVLGPDGTVVAFGRPRKVMEGWAEWLMRAGVWVPQVSELALALRARGVRVEPFPLTVAEGAAALQVFRNAGRSPPHPPVRGNKLPPGIGGGLPQGTCPRVRVRSLSYRYPTSGRLALDDVSLELWPGQLVAIAGANGAGKSSLARHLVRILQPPPGTVWFDGQDVRLVPGVELAQRMGYVFQYPEHQFIGRTLQEDVAFGLKQIGVRQPDAARRATAMLDRFGLAHLAPASPFTLSHGEQRRLSVASMLVLGQRVLLLDEPTFGQDRRNADMLLHELEGLAAAGQAIVTITHDMRLVAERAERVVVMADGVVVFDGPPARLFADRQLVDRARLVPPPLWQLSEALGLRGLTRLEQFLELAQASAGAVVT
jgi:energy-coupling factor transporter ATP-binding protein EcfA2